MKAEESKIPHFDSKTSSQSRSCVCTILRSISNRQKIQIDINKTKKAENLPVPVKVSQRDDRRERTR